MRTNQPDHEMSSPFRFVSAVPKDGVMTNLGRVIRRMRKERDLSQGGLARKAGVSRSLIARIESGQMSFFPAHPLEQIARALEMGLERMLEKAKAFNEALVYPGEVNRIEFTLEFPEEDFRIQSPFPIKKEFFFGKIKIRPQGSVLSHQLPHPELIILYGEVGRVTLTCDGKEYFLKPGEYHSFSGLKDYALYNPDLLKETSSLMITTPSIFSF